SVSRSRRARRGPTRVHRAGTRARARIEGERSARRVSRGAGSEEEIHLDRTPSRRGSGKQTNSAESSRFAVSARAEALLPEWFTRGARARLRRTRWRRSRRSRTFFQRKDLGRTRTAVSRKRRERQAVRELRNCWQTGKQRRTHDRSVDSVRGRTGAERSSQKRAREIGNGNRARPTQ